MCPYEDLRYSSDENTGIRATWILKYSFRASDRFRVDMITHVIQWFGILFVFPSWALYVWIKGSGFGSQPLCNDLVKYVFFFISIRGTVNWLRILAIICFSLRMFSPLILLLSTKRFSPRGDSESRGYFSSISRLASTLWVFSWFPWHVLRGTDSQLQACGLWYRDH